jgi:hypothetical protein
MIIAFNVDMWRLIPITGIEEKPVRPISEYRRHCSMLRSSNISSNGPSGPAGHERGAILAAAHDVRTPSPIALESDQREQHATKGTCLMHLLIEIVHRSDYKLRAIGSPHQNICLAELAQGARCTNSLLPFL